METTINLWCDGSYRQEPRTSGAGWVIRHADGRTEEKSLTLPRLRNSFAYGSQIAELSAAANALNALPAQSRVVIHMDCLIAIESLQAGTLNFQTRNPAPALQTAFKHALKATQRLASVTFEQASDRTDRHMSQAHRLSRAASAPV